MNPFINLFAKKQRKKIVCCGNCGSKRIEEGYYTRAWNNWCKQAAGDKGVYCYNCSQVSFFRTDAEYNETKMEWVSESKNQLTAKIL